MKTLNNIKQGFKSSFRATRAQVLVAIVLSIILALCVSCTEDVPPYNKGIDTGIVVNKDTIAKEVINIDGLWIEPKNKDINDSVIRTFKFENNGGYLFYEDDKIKHSLYYSASSDSVIITIPSLGLKYKFLGFGSQNIRKPRGFEYWVVDNLFLMDENGEEIYLYDGNFRY